MYGGLAVTFITVDPATGEERHRFALHDGSEVESRLQRAAVASGTYGRTSFGERSRLMLGAAALLESELPAWAETMTAEMGKTFASAKGEVAKCVRAMRFFAEHAEAMLADEPVPSSASQSRVVWEPLGVVLAVMPWNFPLWQVVRFAAPSIMAGNVVLLKHAPNVTETALEIESLFRRAGYPDGVLQTLLVAVESVPAIIEDPRVAAVTLTGSDAAGSSVASTAGRCLKKAVLELGGSDPFVVMPSADLQRAVAAAVEGRMQNNGQSCIAAKRFIVHSDVYEAFREGFTEAVSALVVGDPMDPATYIGPLATAAGRDRLSAQVDDALSKGATAECPPGPLARPGFFYRPGVLSGVTRDMRVWREEVFGPVAVLCRVGGVEEAIRVANDTPFGLGASVWTRDEAERDLLVGQIRAGMVFVNEMLSSTPEIPFGGIKRSGIGRELGSAGIRELCALKTVWVA